MRGYIEQGIITVRKIWGTRPNLSQIHLHGLGYTIMPYMRPRRTNFELRPFFVDTEIGCFREAGGRQWSNGSSGVSSRSRSFG